MTLEDHLREDANRYPEKKAVVCGDEQLTYQELWESVAERSKALGDLKGRIVPFRSSQDIQFLVEFFAIHLSNGVAAPLDKDCPDETFRAISQQLLGSKVPEGSADVLYTTGTTGKSKGVIISHRTIIANAENLIGGQQYSHELTFIITGPLNHIGSLSKIYPVILMGATLHILDGMKDLNAFFKAIEEASTQVGTFLVPAHIRMLTSLCATKLASVGEKIDFIETGAAPIAQSDMQRLCELLPNSRLYNTYASTETGIIATYNYNETECLAGCLGNPMRHSHIFITPEGHIACQGDTLMTGYVGDEELTKSVLHDETLFTADLGRLDEKGRLHLSGRKDDIINVGGFKVSPVEVEDAAKTLPCVSDCICIATNHPMMGKMLKLLVVIKEGESFNKRDMAQLLRTRLEAYKVPLLYEVVEKIERTFNGKLNRKFYQENQA